MINDEVLHQVYLGLGSNLGDKEENIRKAITLINEQIGTVVRQSALFYSEPWGFESENQFVNAAICVSTTLTPHQVLKANKRIECQLGKTEAHATERKFQTTYHDRPIDIDILLYDDLHIDEPELKIPHPLMQERDFVMIPLREIRDAITYADPEPSRWHDND
jgi:2-amino-4-hydroxy-6-hydroxymethyldihydropteridine diphosphokinase